MKCRQLGVAVRAALVVGFCGVALLVVSVPALAQDTDAAAGVAARANVRVRVVGALAKDSVLKQRIASWFDPARFSVTVQGVSYLEPQQVLTPEHGSLVEVWVTRRHEKLARLYFANVDADTGKTRYLLRDLALESGLDELGSEALAQAVHLSTVALLEGQAGTSREQLEQSLRAEPAPSSNEDGAGAPAPAAAPTSSAAKPPERALPALETESTPAAESPRNAGYDFSASLGYALSYGGGEGWAHGPRARARVGLAAEWGAVARLQFVLPHRRELTDLNLDLYGGAALLAVSFRKRMSDDFAIDAFAGPSLELVHYQPSARAGAAFAPSPAATELRPQLVFGVLFGFGRWPRLALVPELAIAAHGSHYEAAQNGQVTTVARAARLTPSLGLELEL